jgi:branched-chain amino acid transport system ATP-binding protein
MNEVLLELHGLNAGYGEVTVLRDIDLVVHEREIVALVGSNGAGKTTLLRALAQLIPWRGEMRFAGISLTGSRPELAFGLGMVQVPEGRHLFPRMTVEDNLLMGAYRQPSGTVIAHELERVYTLFPRMRERRRQLAGSLSGGEQQMCAMARALVAGPRLLVVDEMSLGLAPVIVDQLLDVMQQIRQDGVTVLLAEQDVHAAFHIADRGYVVETGRITQEGPAAVLLEDPEVKRAYLGL